MSPLWTSEQAAEATGGAVGGGPWQVGGVAIDTRELAAGDLFVALAGENRDGHAFVPQALAAGAGAVLVAEADAVPPGRPCLVVADTLRGLEGLAFHRRAESAGRIVGITGSAGKTTAKAALATLLAGFGQTHASAKSHNNHWGVPLSLARMPRDASFGVFELGMNHAGEIRALVAQVRPHVALVTTIAPAHLGHFSGEEAIARAKAEIFERVEPGGTVVLPADNRWSGLLRTLAERSPAGRILTFGRDAGADVRLLAEQGGAEGSDVTAWADGRQLSWRLDLPGGHQVDNSLGWLAVALALDLDLDAVAARMPLVRPVDGRGVRRPVELPSGVRILLLDESYNANPASMRAALDVLARQPGRKVAVLGDMLELGPQSDSLHAGLAPALEAAGVQAAYLCGSAMAELAGRLPCPMEVHHAPSSAEILPLLATGLRDGDAVLVKGSLGSRMRVIVDGLQPPGSDRA
ncbi:UDP-N-acetylmuramoyl-tripeptide--D-alanyl-D-alanine ligase [Geminicoccus roseus]|uniref:UDP-N-acetylmuramoyl-tripeptide--D-alanyl-D- alanine ligase n=1 Tax=Geminicoccus roseus TaxID=404900 RepID=UPI0003F8F3CD|nr:UDP-N-acetylmuramoyl-tripeptide--D-alanyl-D-alanine ligase [Geminicoccus roseus]